MLLMCCITYALRQTQQLVNDLVELRLQQLETRSQQLQVLEDLLQVQ